MLVRMQSNWTPTLLMRSALGDQLQDTVEQFSRDSTCIYCKIRRIYHPQSVYSRRKLMFIQRSVADVHSSCICSSPKLKTASVFISGSKQVSSEEGEHWEQKRLPPANGRAVCMGSCAKYASAHRRVLVTSLADQSFSEKISHVVETFPALKEKIENENSAK